MEITKQQQNKFTIFNGAKYFSSGVFQNYLVLIPGSTTRIDSWKSRGMSEENIENKTKSNINFVPAFVDHHVLPDVNSNGHYLINIIYISKKSNKYMYFLHTKSMVKKFKHRFYIK